MANRAAGKGYENENFYSNIKFQFLGIENIHVMRASLQKAMEGMSVSLLYGYESIVGSMNYWIWCYIPVCELKNPSMSSFLSGLESSGWLRHIKAVIDTSVFLATVSLSHLSVNGPSLLAATLHLSRSRPSPMELVSWCIAPMDGIAQPRLVPWLLLCWILTTEPSLVFRSDWHIPLPNQQKNWIWLNQGIKTCILVHNPVYKSIWKFVAPSFQNILWLPVWKMLLSKWAYNLLHGRQFLWEGVGHICGKESAPCW